jgi:hypothetical protein
MTLSTNSGLIAELLLSQGLIFLSE